MTAKQRFATNLRFLRCRARLTMREVAKEIDVTEKRYQHWEYGRATPDYDLLIKIVGFFEVDIKDLLTVNLDQ